ncbi:hypothetical protein [Cellulomonas xiejunii]|uniref:hypothetical protein n=1 Tax=Cellulomonas xiejunii TaxID=2968083 RepID=UPI001D0F0C49|nr:hypothetical protein [Cellulomonas xiejunii]MCC2314529.1 hypothetical protein [Cellulomonas xiejunii]
MNALVTTALTASALSSGRLPGPTYERPTEGSPGFDGFVATFLLALAVIALAVSFTRRMRRATHRDRLRAEAENATPTGTLGDDMASDRGPDGGTDGVSGSRTGPDGRSDDTRPDAGPR